MRERILRRLAGTAVPDDPRAAALAGLDTGLANAFAALRLTPAAVLVPLIERPGGWQLLLTRRQDALRDHAGQVSFPGGRIETDDPSIAAAALREAREEIGLPPERVELAGYLPAQAVVTGFVVVPVVGLVPPDLARVADPREVAEVFEVPLDFLCAPANRISGRRRWGGVEFPVHEYHFAGQRIWGATAQIIDRLVTILF